MCTITFPGSCMTGGPAVKLSQELLDGAGRCRWARASGFDGVTVETETMREVIMLCCAIKPLCAWNGQVGLVPAPCCLSWVVLTALKVLSV